MYRCQLCGSTVPPRTPSHRLVVATRQKRYAYRKEVNRVMGWVDGKWKEKWLDDPGGVGQEIVQELIVCPHCAVEYIQRKGTIL